MSFNYFAERAARIGTDIVLEPPKLPVKSILEAADMPTAAVADFAGQQMRSCSMSCCLAWLEGGDFTYDALLSACLVVCDLDGDGDLSPDEEDQMNECLQGCADALIALGGDPENAASFLDDEDDAAGASLGAFLAEKLNGTSADDEEIIANYAVGGDAVLESMVKVVRGGKVVLKRKRVRKPHITALQRASLKKARTKAFTGAAKVARAKSMRIRNARGM